MYTVCRTHVFQRAAKEAGMSEDEVDDLEAMLAANPLSGDEIAGTGGCRKVRVAKPGGGKAAGIG
jgi:hypothetical protein